MREIKLYTRNLCGWCHDAKEYLKQHGLPFEEIDVGRETCSPA
ncbi:MAG: glutaredoxin domain-containing protein [Verrucomicrobiia bacterium]